MTRRLRQACELARQIGAGGATDRERLEAFRRLVAELGPEGRLGLFSWLSEELEVARAGIAGPAAALQSASEDDREAWNAAVRELRRSLASPRQRLFEALINTGGGMQLVLDLRGEVLEAQRQGEGGLEALEEDLGHLLNRWCQHGLLYLEEIDLRSSYRTVRFLKERELVHPMVSLDEMAQRLGRDRACYALHHAAMPDEPVVFIEVALSRGLLRSIDEVIGRGADARRSSKPPDTAVFYSINSTQNGLAGLGLAQVLILRVTEALRTRYPSLTTFATLSPIPGFWPGYLRPILEGRGAGFRLTREAVVERLSGRLRAALVERGRAAGAADDDPALALAGVLATRDWVGDPGLRRLLRRPLLDIAYTYLAEEKDRRGRPLNPVANFHLGNGASVARANLNFAANTSERGLAESCGLMVNYLYSESSLARIRRGVRSLLPWGRRGRPSGPPPGSSGPA